MQHTPSWGLLAPPVDKTLKLSESTLAVRLAAVECPETAKFGNAGMEGGKEATKLMQSLVEGQQVSVQLLSKDQYARVVGMAHVGRWPFRKNLSEEVLRAGWATIYRQGGAEYGGQLARFERIEEEAKGAKVGLWASGEKSRENAAEYKKRVKENAQ
mmetsp:Transcript_31404/g.70588  ORF Transcript_31404/g.70588 Transcript_31404/m.70588 type:complete len:157 (-) Transcript_31404:237-707(-)